jgi:hypothetical protein
MNPLFVVSLPISSHLSSSSHPLVVITPLVAVSPWVDLLLVPMIPTTTPTLGLDMRVPHNGIDNPEEGIMVHSTTQSCPNLLSIFSQSSLNSLSILSQSSLNPLSILSQSSLNLLSTFSQSSLKLLSICSQSSLNPLSILSQSSLNLLSILSQFLSQFLSQQLDTANSYLWHAWYMIRPSFLWSLQQPPPSTSIQGCLTMGQTISRRVLWQTAPLNPLSILSHSPSTLSQSSIPPILSLLSQSYLNLSILSQSSLNLLSILSQSSLNSSLNPLSVFNPLSIFSQSSLKPLPIFSLNPLSNPLSIFSQSSLNPLSILSQFLSQQLEIINSYLRHCCIIDKHV